MADRVTLRPPQEAAVELELGDRVFTVATMTRSRQKLIDDALKTLDAAETTDAAAAAMIGVIDVMTAPADGQKKGAGSVLLPMWEGDEISVSQLSALMEDMQQAVEARPT